MTKTLPYPPPWQDAPTLAQHLSISLHTIENWVAAGWLPPGRQRGGKVMWKWSEVDDLMTNGKDNVLPIDAGGMRNAVKREREADRASGH